MNMQSIRSCACAPCSHQHAIIRVPSRSDRVGRHPFSPSQASHLSEPSDQQQGVHRSRLQAGEGQTSPQPHVSNPHPTQPENPLTFVRRREWLSLGSVAAVTMLLAGVPIPGMLPAAHAASTQLRNLTPEEQTAVDKAMKPIINKVKAPVVLRLVYHDAGTYNIAAGNGGANASIRFELDRAENFGLKRGWRLIEQVAELLKGGPAAGLSYADLICLAGAQAVASCAGPRIPVQVGRKDATGPDPEGRLPALTFSAQQQKDVFAGMGFTPREFLALSGAHTIGSKGYGAPDKFDNVYYQTLLKQPWLNTKDEMAAMVGLPSDHVLTDDPELNPMIQAYAQDQASFLTDFTAAYVKLTELGV